MINLKVDNIHIMYTIDFYGNHLYIECNFMIVKA